MQEEVRQLRADQAAVAAQQGKADWDAQSQVRFRTVFDRSPLGHKIIDADLRIRQANPAVLTMLGLISADELVGRRILEFAHPAYRADWKQLQESLWNHATPYFTLETCLVRPSGTSFWCEVTSVLFEDADGELGYTTLVDIDARKGLALSLEWLYEAQETILHLVAHDLKTPIAHIQLLIELLRQDAAKLYATPPTDPAETEKFLILIRQCCDEANALIKDILYLGELEATALPKQPTDLPAFLKAQLEVHRVAARAKHITLTLEVPPEGLQEQINPNRFSRVVDNLLSNALKFTPAGGQVYVRLQAQQGRTLLAVQDTGVGIAAAQQAHLFDKFSAARRVGLHGEPTTGLGLFIARQIVRQHGGTIGVESQEGEGSTFSVRFA